MRIHLLCVLAELKKSVQRLEILATLFTRMKCTDMEEEFGA